MPLRRVLEPEVMDTPEEARDYNSMDHSAVNRLFVADLLAVAEAVLSATSPWKILDVGTGTALIPIELCQRKPDCVVTADDLSQEMLLLAVENVRDAGLIERIQPRLADAKSLPDETADFDVVISNSIVHHIPQPAGVLAEMWRVLRPGGVLFVRDLLRPESIGELERLVKTYAGDANAHQQRLFHDSLHAALSLPELESLLQAIEIPTERLSITSDRHWTLVAIKP